MATKSKQITKQMQFSIMNRALDWKFAKEDAQLLKLENATALAVYNDVFSPDLQKALEMLPDWMVQVGSKGIGVDTQTNAAKEKYGIGDFHLSFAEGVTKRLPFTGRYHQRLPEEIYELLTKKTLSSLLKLKEQNGALSSRKGEFRNRLRHLLESVRTTAQLTSLLPESADWLPEVYQCSDIPQADDVADLLKI